MSCALLLSAALALWNPVGDLRADGTTRSSVGARDALEGATLYEVEECLGPASMYTQSATGTNASAGQSNLSFPPDGTLLHHPGVLSAVVGGVGVAGSYINRVIVTSKGSGVNFVWRGHFRMPSAASTAADRYVFSVGTITYSAGTVTSGAYIQYSHDLNSGNWTCYTGFTAVQANNSVATSTPVPAMSTWHVLQITNPAGTALYSFELDGVPLCQVTDAWQQGGGVIQHSQGGLHMNRTASAANATVTAVFDRASFYLTGLVR